MKKNLTVTYLYYTLVIHKPKLCCSYNWLVWDYILDIFNTLTLWPLNPIENAVSFFYRAIDQVESAQEFQSAFHGLWFQCEFSQPMQLPLCLYLEAVLPRGSSSLWSSSQGLGPVLKVFGVSHGCHKISWTLRYKKMQKQKTGISLSHLRLRAWLPTARAKIWGHLWEQGLLLLIPTCGFSTALSPGQVIPEGGKLVNLLPVWWYFEIWGFSSVYLQLFVVFLDSSNSCSRHCVQAFYTFLHSVGRMSQIVFISSFPKLELIFPGFDFSLSIFLKNF